MTVDVDVVVVGAGIVGLATAREILLRRPGVELLVVDKEPAVATHQSGRNSGVIHSGVYYRPGSAKARLAVDGRRRLEAFCDEAGVPFRRSGKVIVASVVDELSRLEELDRRGRANGVDVERIGREELAEREPAVAGVGALWVPEAGVVDFSRVSEALAAEVVGRGGEIRLGWEVDSVAADGDQAVITGPRGTITARRVVVCAGLHATRLAGRAADGLTVLPFRGEFHHLRPERADLVKALVYPLPDPRFPFLGVHATRGIDDQVHLGPNAVLALAPEGYRWRDVDLGHLAHTAGSAAFWRLAARHWRTGLGEVARSLSDRLFLRQARRLLPDLEPDDLVAAPSGVRAQAVDGQGRLVDDFVIRGDGPVTHVLNAPSPAATAALAIADHIAQPIDLGGGIR